MVFDTEEDGGLRMLSGALTRQDVLAGVETDERFQDREERCDLYRLDPDPKATPLGQVFTRKRRFTWVAGKRFFAYLYKLRGFGRGGKEVAIFKVGTK